MQLSHLIFTRFNIQYEIGDTIGIQPEWLDERLRLFEQYCMPSMQAQTCQDFTWILIGDIRTPDSYKARIEAYAAQLPQIRVYWTPYRDDGYHAFYKQIGREWAKGKDLLISTRLDNDDAFAKNYVASVQQSAKEGVEGIISFPVGRQTFIKDHKSYRIRYALNHSTSRIERSDFETVMVFDHTQVAAGTLHIVETGQPMWEEIVHGGNMLNDYVPKYHYYIRNGADAIDLSKRWIRFQAGRLMRRMKVLFVRSDKA